MGQFVPLEVQLVHEAVVAFTAFIRLTRLVVQSGMLLQLTAEGEYFVTQVTSMVLS